MVHLQARHFVIHPRTLIDKHIKILRNLHKNISVNFPTTVTSNGAFLDVATEGNVQLQVHAVSSTKEEYPVSVYPYRGNVVVEVVCINKETTPIETVVKNIGNVVNGEYSDMPNSIAHEAVHLIDVSKNPDITMGGFPTLQKNFKNNVWEEINAFLNEVVYAYPEALTSYDKFVEYMMKSDVDYKVSDKKATIRLANFKPSVESILSSNLG